MDFVISIVEKTSFSFFIISVAFLLAILNFIKQLISLKYYELNFLQSLKENRYRIFTNISKISYKIIFISTLIYLKKIASIVFTIEAIDKSFLYYDNINEVGYGIEIVLFIIFLKTITGIYGKPKELINFKNILFYNFFFGIFLLSISLSLGLFYSIFYFTYSMFLFFISFLLNKKRNELYQQKTKKEKETL